MLTKKVLNTIKEKLLLEKKERLQKFSQHNIEIDSDGDETDEVQANIQIELHHQFAGLNKAKLEQINEALNRIKNNTYGICVDCEEQIPEKRLLLNPYFTICVPCAEDREMEEEKARKIQK